MPLDCALELSVSRYLLLVEIVHIRTKPPPSRSFILLKLLSNGWTQNIDSCCVEPDSQSFSARSWFSAYCTARFYRSDLHRTVPQRNPFHLSSSWIRSSIIWYRLISIFYWVVSQKLAFRVCLFSRFAIFALRLIWIKPYFSTKVVALKHFHSGNCPIWDARPK